MRIILFGSGGPFSTIAFDTIADQLVAVVVPLQSWWRRIIKRNALAQLAKSRGIRVVDMHDLATLDADLIVVASFPQKIGTSIRESARLGAINVHPSLLPKHRGPDPLFWTYLADDDETGVTLHWIDDGIDSGDIIAQERVPIARNTDGVDLYMQLANRGAVLLAQTLPNIEQTSRSPQGESQAEPSPAKRTWRIDYATMTTSRLAHFLHGVAHRRAMVLPDAQGAWHRIGAIANAVERAHDRAPGTIEGNRVYLLDGWIELR